MVGSSALLSSLLCVASGLQLQNFSISSLCNERHQDKSMHKPQQPSSFLTRSKTVYSLCSRPDVCSIMKGIAVLS